MQSFNLESFGKNLDKKLKPNPEQQQPTKKYKSKREKDIHELIDTIKSERMFIYKNAHRHLKLALENVTLALNLPMLLKDFHVTLKEFDALESSLRVELESLEILESDSSDTSVNTSLNNINDNAITTAIASLSVNPVNTGVSLSTASTSTSTPTRTTTTTTSTSNSRTKNNNSTLVSKPKTLGARSIPIDMNSSDDEEDEEKDDDSDEDYVDDSNDSTPPPSSKTKEISKTNTSGIVSTATTTTPNGTTATTDDTTEESKRKGRPPKVVPECCYVCRVTSSPYWRRGTDNDVVVDLCNACGLYYMKKEKKERLSRQKHSIKNVLN
ncbi:hypothetical protein ACTFIY_008314 [Dictyostelium cf. discoideum]